MSSLQNCASIDFYHFQSPGVQHLVAATLANSDREGTTHRAVVTPWKEQLLPWGRNVMAQLRLLCEEMECGGHEQKLRARRLLEQVMAPLEIEEVTQMALYDFYGKRRRRRCQG